MVGVGREGLESSLARVSLVNFYGAIQLDVFVRQRERVVDYRTQYSGIRARDLVNGKFIPHKFKGRIQIVIERCVDTHTLATPFAEAQQLVANLLKDRILVGHAVHNDLKVSNNLQPINPITCHSHHMNNHI